MHEAFWNGLFDTRWEDAPLGPEAIRLVLWLRGRGYAERTRRDYAHAVVHLGRVLLEAQADVALRALDEAIVEEFIDQHLPVCRCFHQRPGRRADAARGGLTHLLAMLREEGVIPPLESDDPPYHELLEDYCRFLRRDRGLAETTVTNYRRYLHDFLASRGDAVSPTELTQLTADDLLAFSRQRLRGCEVRALCLDDIDWSRDEITVFTPKTGRRRRLPLTHPVGEAILDYLRAERPPSLRREIFLSSRPPHAPLRSKINRWLADRLKKAGIETPRGGAHILRHSLAVHMLRGGQTLKHIGDVLGHRSPETTFIYTKLQVEDLRTVALEPEVVS